MKIRINDFECRSSIYREDEYEMVKWQVNQYYGQEKFLIEWEGYEKVEYEGGNWALKRDFHSINSSCFKNPETCYVIATLKLNRREPDVDMETVGSRLLELEPNELNVFMKVYRLAQDMIMQNLNEDESK